MGRARGDDAARERRRRVARHPNQAGYAVVHRRERSRTRHQIPSGVRLKYRPRPATETSRPHGPASSDAPSPGAPRRPQQRSLPPRSAGGLPTPQSGGFEGLGSVQVHLHSRYEAIAERPDLCEAHLQLWAALLCSRTLADERDHLMPAVEDLLDIERPVLERSGPLRQPPVRLSESDASLQIQTRARKRSRIPDEVWLDRVWRQLSSADDVLEAAPEQIEVLLRRRRPQYARLAPVDV